MSKDRVVVMLRLTNGDTVLCSTKSFNRAELNRDMHQRMASRLDDLLYFTVRVTKEGEKSNYRTDTVVGLEAVLNAVFATE